MRRPVSWTSGLVASALVFALLSGSDAQTMCGPGLPICVPNNNIGSKGCCSKAGYCAGWSLTDPYDPYCKTDFCQPQYSTNCYGGATGSSSSSSSSSTTSNSGGPGACASTGCGVAADVYTCSSSQPKTASMGQQGYTGCCYTVKWGDFCCRIALNIGTVVQHLYEQNNWIENSSLHQCGNLQPNDVLNVPCSLPGYGKSPEKETNKECYDYNCQQGSCGPSCTDKVKNQDESDVDCGGSSSGCPRCANGLKCNGGSDCQSNYCLSGVCSNPASCTDYMQNQGETDVDCGGPNCPYDKCGNLCVDCQIVYPCVPSSTQVTGSDPAATCPAPPPPEPPCYGQTCPPDPSPCIPDLTDPICKQAAATFGLPGACFQVVTNLTALPFKCPCMCAGICSGGYCGDGVCNTPGSAAAKCATCNCQAPKASPPPSPPPPAPPPAGKQACSDSTWWPSTGWSPKVYISNPSLTTNNGNCICVNGTNSLVFRSCRVRNNVTDVFQLSAGFPDSWFQIKNVKTGLCVELKNFTSTTTQSFDGGATQTTVTIVSFKAELRTCDASIAGQNWKYSYYLGLMQCKTGHFLGPVGGKMDDGTLFMGYPVPTSATSANIVVTPYEQLTNSWIIWPTTQPTCGFTGAVVSLSPDDTTHLNGTYKGVTFPAKKGSLPVVPTMGNQPTNLQLCLDATTIQVYNGVIMGMVSFLPCVAGKASQYVQTVTYNKFDWAVEKIGDAAFAVTNRPPGWPEGHFFLTFPKVKPNLCFDIYRSQGRGVAVIHYKCHPTWLPGNQLWSIDWTRGHIRNTIPSHVDVFNGGQGQKGNPVCVHFDRTNMNVFSANCTGTVSDNKFLWKYQQADQKPFQVNTDVLIATGR